MSSRLRPLVFLDLDDVLCLNEPYGGHHILARDQPKDLWERLFSRDAKFAVLEVVREHRPSVVLTTTWLRLFDRAGFRAMFRATGLGVIAESLHDEWAAPQIRGKSRLHAVDSWLNHFHIGEPFVVIDDSYSGTGLVGSHIDTERRLVLCDVGVGLGESHLGAIHRALVTPPNPRNVA